MACFNLRWSQHCNHPQDGPEDTGPVLGRVTHSGRARGEGRAVADTVTLDSHPPNCLVSIPPLGVCLCVAIMRLA